MALALNSWKSRTNIDENFRVSFWSSTYNYIGSNTTNATDAIPIQAVKCVDMYAEEIARETEEDPTGQTGFFTQEFQMTEYEWICPNITQITLLND